MRHRRRLTLPPGRLRPAPAGAASGQIRAFLGSEDEFAARVEQPLVEVAEMERAARRVSGVHACQVLRGSGARLPHLVRLVALGHRRTAVAKDVQSAWYALWGLYVPRRLFVVTPVRAPADLGFERGRLQLRQVAMERTATEVAAKVALLSRGRRLEGRAAEPHAGGDVRRLAALAALAALRGALPQGYEPELLDLRRLRVGGVPALLCAISGPHGDPLLGVCRAGADEHESAVRAVLDAINRVLGR